MREKLVSNRTSIINKSKLKFCKIFKLLILILIIINTIYAGESIQGKKTILKYNLKIRLIHLEKESTIEFNSLTYPIATEQVNLEKGLERINSPSNSEGEEHELLFVSTLDGFIHAYSSTTNRELWKINLGKPLINSNVNPKNFVLEQSAIIPGLDGNIYLYSSNTGDNILKKIEIPLKTLIDNSPFTLPNVSKYIFIGDKKSSMYSIDINKGTMVSKFTNGEDNLLENNNMKINNMMTLIRIDYTLICMHQENGNQMWNVTVSEVMAIQKGAKSEITIRHEGPDDYITQGMNQTQIANNLNNLIENNPNLNSIVSVHKYNINSDLPVKIYDIKPEIGRKNSESNFIEFFNENYGDLRDKPYFNHFNNYQEFYSEKNYDRNFYHMLSDYLKWTKEKLLKNERTQKSFLQYLIFKFWEMYYFEEFFFVYLTIIFFLMVLIIILITIIIKYIRTNKKLTRKYNKIRKSSEDRKTLTDVVKTDRGIDDKNKNKLNHPKIDQVNTTTAVAVYNPTEIIKIIENQSLNEMSDKIYKIKSENTNNLTHSDSSFPNLIQLQKSNSLEQFKMIPTHKFENETLFKHQFDLGLKNYQIANQAMINVKTYIDNDGSLVQEEQRIIKTKYETNSTVENKIEELKNQLSIINKMSGDCEVYSKQEEKYFKNTKSFCKRQRVNSCSGNYQENQGLNHDFDSSYCRNQKRKRNNSSSNRDLDNKFKLNFSFLAKEECNKLQIVIKNDTSQRETKIKTDDCEINESDLKFSPNKKDISNRFDYSKNDINAIVSNNSQGIQLYSSNKKPKYKFKEYNIVNNESIKLKINTTYIDEDRLEKNFEAIEKIGQGGFGCVFKARHKIDGWYYAIKMIELKVPLSKNLMEHKVIKEVKTMMKLNHKNVVRYTTCWFQLQIGKIESLLELSGTVSESNKILSFSKSKSLLLSNNRNPYNKKKTSVKVLNEISENEEKSSSHSVKGFMWGDHQENSLSLKRNNTQSVIFEHNHNDVENQDKTLKEKSHISEDIKNNDTNKALSVSFEKNRENESVDNISKSDDDNSSENNNKTCTIRNTEKAHDDSEISNTSPYLNKKQKHKEPSYKVYFFMQMEFCDGLSLNQYLEMNKETGLDRSTIFNFFKQIVSGVNHIHKNNVIHRDLK